MTTDDKEHTVYKPRALRRPGGRVPRRGWTMTTDDEERMTTETRRACEGQRTRAVREGPSNVRSRGPHLDSSHLLVAVVTTLLVYLVAIFMPEGVLVL